MSIDGGAPRHGHRTPAEIAEDEIMAVFRGESCEVPGNAAQREARGAGSSRNERLLPVRNADRVSLGPNLPPRQRRSSPSQLNGKPRESKELS